MLKTVKKSANKKLGGCAATYRAGEGSVYSTCPNTCELKPSGAVGSDRVDQAYLDALIGAVPEGGVSWTYSHFPLGSFPISQEGQTCINFSADNEASAVEAFLLGYPTVVVQPHSKSDKVDTLILEEGSIRVVRCPAEYSDRTCFDCGGSSPFEGLPLCARPDRDYIIKFTAHGAQSMKIQARSEGRDDKGGCYGNSGPVRLQWEKSKGATGEDAETLLDFVRTLPPGTKLRHHVVGDIG